MEQLESGSWFSFSWFSIDLVVNQFEYERSYMLYMSIFLPIALIVFGLTRIYRGANLKVDDTWNAQFSYVSLLALIPWFFFVSAIGLICFAMARPQKENEMAEAFTEGIDIMLALDISGSMVQGTDIKPNRLEKTKEIAADFVSKREHDNIGLVLFAGETFVKAPLTQDKEMLRQLISEISPYEIESQGTAIGGGCALAVSMLKESKAKSRIMILLSDGENTAGEINPMGGAALADAHDIKIYAIGVGGSGSSSGGIFSQLFNQAVDFTELESMAKLTKGKFFHAINEEVLKNVFKEIDELETSKIDDNRYKSKSDYYHIYVSWAILFFMLFIMLRSTFMVGLLRD